MSSTAKCSVGQVREHVKDEFHTIQVWPIGHVGLIDGDSARCPRDLRVRCEFCRSVKLA